MLPKHPGYDGAGGGVGEVMTGLYINALCNTSGHLELEGFRCEEVMCVPAGGGKKSGFQILETHVRDKKKKKKKANK